MVFMSLEKIVNALLKPVEKLAGIVYDAAFATTDKDGKKTYSGGAVQKYFERAGKSYNNLKSLVMKYTVKPVDKIVSYGYNTLEKYFLKPLTKCYDAHPILTSVGLVSLGLYLL